MKNGFIYAANNQFGLCLQAKSGREMEPGLRVTGQRVTGSAIWVRVGSGHGSKPWPGFLTRILVQCCCRYHWARRLSNSAQCTLAHYTLTLTHTVHTNRYFSAITPYRVDRGLLHEYTSRRRISRTMQWCKPFCWAIDCVELLAQTHDPFLQEGTIGCMQ